MKILLALVALLTPIGGLSAQVTLSNEVLVERVSKGPDGKAKVVLQTPSSVVPGDKLVFVLTYKNGGAKSATDFVITNPLPKEVRLRGEVPSGAVVSVDGGKTWGSLAALQVKQADGTSRAAAVADVTDVRWAFGKPIPAGASGKVRFDAVVR